MSSTMIETMVVGGVRGVFVVSDRGSSAPYSALSTATVNSGHIFRGAHGVVLHSAHDAPFVHPLSLSNSNIFSESQSIGIFGHHNPVADLTTEA